MLGAALLLLIVLSLAPSGSGVAPSKAQAFIGESQVLDGAGSLTKEAEEVIKVPDFFPEIWEGGGDPPPPPDEIGGWFNWGEGGGFLPELGAGALAFGVGTVVGSIICNELLELEGCWYFSSEGADPTVSGGSWHFLQSPPTQETVVPFAPYYSWWWRPTGYSSTYSFPYKGITFPSGCSGVEPPTTYSGFVEYTEHAGGSCELFKPYFKTGLYRYVQENRKLEPLTKAEAESLHSGGTPYSTTEYCPIGGSCSAKPPSNWPERLAKCLESPSSCGLTTTQRDHIGEHIAAKTPSGVKVGVHDPYATYITVPTCSGEAWIECKEELEELELVPERTELDWEHAVIADPPDRVEELSPTPGHELETGSKVTVITNPDTEGMPAVIPEITKGETYDEYVAKFSPALDPTRDPVSDAAADASLGPDAALRTDPVEGTREDPKVTTDVDVQTNPKDLPPGAGGVTCSTASPELDFSPLNKNLGSKFPFGIVAFFVGWVEEWETEFPTPEFTVHIPHAGTIHIDMGSVTSLLPPIRIAIVFAAFVGMLWFLGTAALKIQGDSSE